MTFRPRRIQRRPFVASLALAALSACRAGPASGPGGSRFEPYAGGWPTLFDDAIDPSSVGLSMSSRSPVDDPSFRGRVTEAELVARVRVRTVTRETRGVSHRYLLTLEVGRPPLVTTGWDEPTIELRIEDGVPAYGVVRSLDTRMRGKTFVAFVRRFAGSPEPVTHFHLTDDTAEVAQAVERYSAFDALRGP